MDDYMQKIQSMGFDNASMIALSGNKEFDRVYNDNALAYLGKSGSPVYKHPDQLKVNMGIQGTIPPKEDDGKRYMQIVGIERQILMALEERNQMERFIAEFCKTSSSNCEQYRKKIEDANKTIEDAQNMLRELNPEAREIDRITGEIERLKKRDSEMSWADKTEELAYEQLRRIDELEQQGIINSSTAEKMRQTAINDILAAKTVRATTDAYNEVKSFANEKIEIAKDLWENPGEYFADERVDKAVSHLGVDAVTIVGGLTGPVATVALGQYNEYAHQYIDNGAINHVDATKDHLKGIATDKALEYIPYGSHVATGKAAYGIIGGVWNVFKSVHEVGIERIQQK
jgi:hypothetical protein